MPFPFTVDGEGPLIGLEGDEISDTCDRVVSALETQGASATLYDLPRISLKVPMWRGFRWNWDIAAPLDRVELQVVQTGSGPVLRYRLSMVRLVGIVTLVVLALPFMARNVAPFFPGWMWVFMWGWPVLGNWLFTKLRAARFFRRAMSKSEPLAPVEQVAATKPNPT